jgi:hypothetical protein
MTDRRRSLTQAILAAFVPLSFLLALFAWGLASPIGASPDDDYHMSSIWCAQGPREGLPEVLLSSHICFAFHQAESAQCSEGESTGLVESDRGNFTGTYPPLYYVAMSVFASSDVAASIIAMRWFNALVFVSLATALTWLVRRSNRGPLIWGSAVVLVPLGMFLIPSVNPSSWAITGATVLWLSLVAFYRERSPRRRAALAGLAIISTVLASGARADAAVYSGIAAVIAAVMSFERSRRFLVSSTLPAALALVAFAFFRAAGQAAIVSPVASDGNTSALLQLNLVRLPELWAGALGTWGLGWLDTDLPGLVWFTMISAFAALVFWGLRELDWHKGAGLIVIAVVLVVVPMYILVHDRVLVGEYVQPRYIYPLLVMLVGISLWRMRRDDLVLGRVQHFLLIAAVALANATALHTNLRRYITGNDVLGINLDVGAEWWWSGPIGPMAVWSIGAVTFTASLVGAAVLVRKDLRWPRANWRSSREVNLDI